VLISAASICVNIFIQMEQVTENILNEYANIARITGRTSDNADVLSVLRPTKNEFLEYINIEHVKDIKFFRYNFATTFIKENISELTSELHIDGEIIPLFVFRPVFILGYNMSLLHLEENGFVLESGRIFENNGEAVIAKNRIDTTIFGKWDEYSEEWIETKGWNDLNLGNKIIIQNNAGIYKEFIITGILEQNPNDVERTNRWMIYTTLESAEYFDNFADLSDMNLTITPSSGFVTQMENNNLIRMGYDGLIYVDHPDNYWNLRTNMYAAGIWIEPLFPNFRIITDLTHNMQIWSIIFITIIGLIIIFVTIIATLILFNTRKYEIAVLRSVGMKKSRLIINYLIEKLTLIWFISIVSLISAQFITRIFTIEVFESIKEFVSVEFFESLTHGLKFELLLQNIGLVFVGTTAVVILSLVLACINIIRFEPLKIFNKQY
jgi:hypothetical protein